MDDDQQSTPRSDFDARLAAARRAIQPVAQDARRGSAMGVAIRLSTDLVAAVAVGGFLGWLLDRWLGTSPWLLLLFFFLGVAAG
ncbi:MAG TPA: phosphoribosylaminoimidazolecarboxamide formyltransferase, partial [Alphaproteobacteria bacterium]|nr:phosphoribosylaminoimidazolecarboxamide formyltransferase [Alphaproteobacteria bacterium]